MNTPISTWENVPVGTKRNIKCNLLKSVYPDNYVVRCEIFNEELDVELATIYNNLYIYSGKSWNSV